MSSHFTKAMVVFARAPQSGRVKSRLAREIGEVGAAECYAAFLRDTLHLASRAEREISACRAFVAHTLNNAFEAGPHSLAPFWDGSRLPQTGANLGERMAHCIQTLHSQGTQDVVLIGSDSPDLKFEFIEQAFEFLQTNNLVFGPAEDGGFYLIGAHREYCDQLPELFQNVNWSTQSTLHEVLVNAKDLNLPAKFLPKWSDVDRLEDLQNLAARLESEYSVAPHTRQWLRLQNFF